MLKSRFISGLTAALLLCSLRSYAESDLIVATDEASGDFLDAALREPPERGALDAFDDEEVMAAAAPFTHDFFEQHDKLELRFESTMDMSAHQAAAYGAGTSNHLFIAPEDSFSAQSNLNAPDNSTLDVNALAIEGDKLEMNLDRSMRVMGNAKISRGEKTIAGDVIDYNVQNDNLVVTGNASIDVGNAELTGSVLDMRLSDGVGSMTDASIEMLKTTQVTAQATPQNNIKSFEIFSTNSAQIKPKQGGNAPAHSAQAARFVDVALIENTENEDEQEATAATDSATSRRSTTTRGDAKTILFEGQDKKVLKDARYTTCTSGVDDWYIKAKEIDLNDYTESGVAKNAYIEFKGVPVIYTPWVSFSFNNQRKSGFLAPTYGTTTKSGLELSVPYYWNIAPDMDATLAMRGLSKRGVQLQGEFRYLQDTFSGVDNVEFLARDNQTSKNRYYANLKHQQSFGGGWSAGYGLEKVSDDEYFADMSTRIVTTSRVNLPQQLNVNYADDVWRFNALAQKFQTLDKQSYPYERLPQMTLYGNERAGGVEVNLYNQFVLFDTNTHATSKVTGARLTTYPSVSFPISASYGYITPKIGVHYTQYNLNNIQSDLSAQSRTLPIASLDAGLFFDRNFIIAGSAYSQSIEPRIFYVYIPNKKQSDIPIFDTSEADLNFTSLFSENQYTGNDRVNDANQISFALTSRLIESDTGIQRLSASIGQRYYFDSQKVTLPGAGFRRDNNSDIIGGLSSYLDTTWNLDAFWQYNAGSAKLVRTTLASHYNPAPGQSLNLSYSYRQSTAGALTSNSLNQIDASTQWPLGRGWYAVARGNYSLLEGRMIETLAGLEYDAGCWQTRTVVQRVNPATSTANYALFFQLELGGLASIGANPLSVIKRNVPGYVNTGLIPNADK